MYFTSKIKNLKLIYSSNPAIKKTFILILVSFSVANLLIDALPARTKKRLVKNSFVADAIITTGEYFGLNQEWSMFAPPPDYNAYITINYQLENGKWSRHEMPFAGKYFIPNYGFFLPAGVERIATHIRYAPDDLILSDKKKHRMVFFSKFADYYCYGDGKVPNISEIRFYLNFNVMPYMYDKGIDGKRLPPVESYMQRKFIYLKKCDENKKRSS